jgi:hypothetical protein
MVGPCEVLPVGLAESTTQVEGDVDGGPPRGALSAGPAASATEF